jgi:hypothetical protein
MCIAVSQALLILPDCPTVIQKTRFDLKKNQQRDWTEKTTIDLIGLIILQHARLELRNLQIKRGNNPAGLPNHWSPGSAIPEAASRVESGVSNFYKTNT